MSIIISTPGKIHLLGEHTVVYGKPALLAALDKRLYVEIKQKITDNRKQITENVVINTKEDKKLVQEAIKIFKDAYSIETFPPLEIKITSQIPTGCGLGSSAALSGALIGALMKHVKNIWNPAKINELSYMVEKKAHGNPSGADNTAVVFGGLVWFRKEFDFLKSIWNLPVKTYKIPRFLLINTGCPVESTKEMVAGVAKFLQKKKKFMENLFEDQEKLTKKLLLSLRIGDMDQMRESIKNGERNLEKMGVVGKYAQKIIKEIEKIGGVAKACGGGGVRKGSGALLCYHDNLSALKSIAEKYHLESWSSILGGEGVRMEK